MSYIFLVGASAGTFTTLTFLYVLARFPSFLLHVRSEGADPDVVVRLSTFYQLNVSLFACIVETRLGNLHQQCVRIIFRFFFTLPLIVLAVDGLRAPYPVVGDPYVFPPYIVRRVFKSVTNVIFSFAIGLSLISA
jgi:hypothetical protein